MLSRVTKSQAGSSVVERGLYTARVAGSIPVPPTRQVMGFVRFPERRAVLLPRRSARAGRARGLAHEQACLGGIEVDPEVVRGLDADLELQTTFGANQA